METMARVRALLLDVDGVLTTGEITYDAEGREIKSFYVRDGLGIRLLHLAKIPVGVITGRASAALRHRLDNLNIIHLAEGVWNKAEAVERMCGDMGVEPGQAAFVADDLLDVGGLETCGVPLAVADAHPEVIARAAAITRSPGGRGAVREICEALLKSQGLWEQVVGKLGA
ncbi:MAG: HAD hydrolase family protein [Deltaproteobacteria bacterium]|nr:HAD hydrolase family protein [Deltaproteobacteria bacterium]